MFRAALFNRNSSDKMSLFSVGFRCSDSYNSLCLSNSLSYIFFFLYLWIPLNARKCIQRTVHTSLCDHIISDKRRLKRLPWAACTCITWRFVHWIEKERPTDKWTLKGKGLVKHTLQRIIEKSTLYPMITSMWSAFRGDSWLLDHFQSPDRDNDNATLVFPLSLLPKSTRRLF